MSTYTALQLVNRVHLRMGGMELADLTTQRAKLLMNLVNEAKDIILESKTWDFDKRTDGVLVVKGVLDDTGATSVTNASDSYSSTGGAFTCGDFTARLLVTSDANFADVA